MGFPAELRQDVISGCNKQREDSYNNDNEHFVACAYEYIIMGWISDTHIQYLKGNLCFSAFSPQKDSPQERNKNLDFYSAWKLILNALPQGAKTESQLVDLIGKLKHVRESSPVVHSLLHSAFFPPISDRSNRE